MESEARAASSVVVAAIKLQGGEGWVLLAVDHNRGGSGHRPVHSIAETGGEASCTPLLINGNSRAE